MDCNVKTILEKKIQKTIENLKKNRMGAFYCPTSKDAVKCARGLLKDGDVVTNGGSMTLREAGIIDLLKSGRYTYLDRDEPGLSPERKGEILRRAFSADCYFTSANAVTEEGELYCVDGNGNRIAAMIFGPRQVIVVAGYNKIVTDLHAAEDRIRSLAAPANAARLGLNNPCVKTGSCADCRLDSRICSIYTRFGHQSNDGRITVLLVGEELGY
ncbi:MAG TPA: lactate utilization protein [Clostridia bacterium]|nr:lactate utilization protein [Clostridia bacterium]